MKKRKLYWIIGIVLVIALATGGVYMKVKASKQATTSTNLRTSTVSRGTVTLTISGTGTVQSQQNAMVSWQTSGTVQSVSASIGQQVKKGDELAALDPSTLPTSVLQAQLDLIEAQEALAALKEPKTLEIAQAQAALDEAQKALDALLNPSEAAISQAKLAVIEAQEAVNTAQNYVNKLQYGRGSAEAIATAQAAYVVAQAEVTRLEEEYKNVGGDPKEDPRKAQALSALEAAKTKRNKALATLNWYKGERTESEIESTLNDLVVAQGTLADAQEALDKLLNPSEVDLALAQAKVDNARETLESLKAGPSETDLLVAETRVTLAEAAVAQASLTAPFTGTVTDLDVMTGDIVSAGKTAVRIDDLSKLYIELTISEMDIPSVKVGQEATVVFDAISNREYHAVVTRISMVASVSQGVVNYPVIVQITDADSSILPSMTAAVNIIVEKAENVLTVPNNALRISNGQRLVIVLFEGQQISVPVTVGLAGDSTSEVISEQLREGDTVVLSSTSTISSGGGSSASNSGTFEFGGGMGPMIP
jgi:RND family efflux transporter MFP subunit